MAGLRGGAGRRARPSSCAVRTWWASMPSRFTQGARSASDERPQLVRLTRIGVERMEEHRRDHGVDYDRIMVFPQGVFSECPAMTELRSHGGAGRGAALHPLRRV